MGIVLNRQFPFFFDDYVSNLAILLLFCLFALILYLSLQDYKAYRTIATIAGLIAFVLFGYYRTANYHALSKPTHYAYVDQASIYVGKIQELPIQGKHVKCILEITSAGTHVDSMISSSGTLLAYFESDSTARTLAPGDILVCEVSIRDVKTNANPLVFDYKQYLDNRNIHYQGFVKTNKWERVASGTLPWYWQQASRLRLYSLGVINKHIDEVDNKAVLSAMLLGIRSLITDELYDAYTDTGAVHVLAVSGLHVGIFTFILYWFFGLFMISNPLFKWVKLAFILIVIWSFVLVTGAAPAVTRAALMSSLVLIAHAANRRVSTYNVLAITAMVMLIYNPLMLYQASFQFSFLALFSILFFMPILIGYGIPSHWLAQKIVSLLYVSIAAQMLVLPLTIFFFHKFATYFWLSGIFVIPAAFLILCFGLLLLVFDGIGQILQVFDLINEQVISRVLEGIISITNYLIARIQMLPMSAIDGLWLNKVEVGILYLAIIALMVACVRRDGWIAIGSMCIFLAYGIQRMHWNHEVGDNQSIVIYDVYGRSLLDIFHQENVYSLPEESHHAIASKNAFIRGNNRYAKGVNPQSGLPVFCSQKGAFLSVGEKLILFAGHDSIYQYKSIVPVDYAIVQDNYIIDMVRMRAQFDIRNIIVDGTNRYQSKKEIRQACYKYKMPYQDTQYGAIEIPY